MLTKEQLQCKYLIYSPEITEEIFDRIIDKLENEHQLKPTSKGRIYKYSDFIKENAYLYIGTTTYHVCDGENCELRITVKDILGESEELIQEIPEYVKYIKSDDLGQIVKVLQWTPHSYCRVEFFDGTIKEPFKHLVKFSTKEAYERQNSKTKEMKEEFILPERWYCLYKNRDEFNIANEFFKGHWAYVESCGFCNNKGNNNFWASHDISRYSNYVEITFEQFQKYVVGKSEIKKDAEFEVGKWYDIINKEGKYYIKVNEISNGFITGDFIVALSYYRSGGFIIDEIKQSRLLINLSEIQQHLPDGHIDKIKKEEMKYVKLLIDNCGYKKGDIAKVISKDGGYIVFVPNRTSTSALAPNVHYSENRVTLATEEEYNAQHSPKEEEYKVGDWVKIIDAQSTQGCKLNNGDILQISNIRNSIITTKPMKTSGGEIYKNGIKKATNEEILSVSKGTTEKPFEFNKWYIYKGETMLVCYQKDNRGYGFIKDKWSDCLFISDTEWREATKEEVEQRLLKEAKRRYSVGCKFKSAYDPSLHVRTYNEGKYLKIEFDGIATNLGEYVYYKGKWAEIVEEAPIKPKEMTTDFKKGDKVIVISDSSYNWGNSSGDEKPIVGREYTIKYQPADYIKLNALSGTGYIAIKPCDVKLSTETSKEITEAYGLKIGDVLPANVISKWGNESYKSICLDDSIPLWENRSYSFCTDRYIESFKEINGHIGFLVSNTMQIYLKAEGFKQFMDSMTSKHSSILTEEQCDILSKKFGGDPPPYTYEGTKFYHGDSITCIIDGEEIDDARVSIEDDELYICQNIKDGDKADELFDYRYSWLLDEFVEDLQHVSKHGMRKTEEDNSSIKLLLVDVPEI